jgi:hypothetical protein
MASAIKAVEGRSTAGASAADFGTSDVRRYIASRRRTRAANGSINRELAILKRAFHLAAENGPPRVYPIPHFPMFEENNVRKAFRKRILTSGFGTHYGRACNCSSSWPTMSAAGLENC